MEEVNPLSAFDSANVVRLRPGDVVLFRCSQILSPVAIARVKEMLDEVFPDHESVILDGGRDIALLRQPEPGFIARLFRKK